MAEVCGYEGCGHLVAAPGECGDRKCPRNTERRPAISSAVGRGRTGLGAQADAAAEDAFGLRPGRVDLLWHDPSGPYGKKHRGPYRYDAFVPAPLAEVDLAIPASLAGELERAARAVTDLNHSQTANLEAVAGPLLRSESVASSRIENLRVSHRRVAEALVDPQNAAAAAREVANNVAAMTKAIALAERDLDRNMIRAVHRALLAGTRDEAYAGVERSAQNWIGGQSPRDAFYVPPPPEFVRPLLDDLVAFANRDDLPVIAHAALVHAQFEGIHPFVDGNGRTGRCLVHALLHRRALAPTLVPPISAALLTDRDGYYAVLADYQQRGNPIPLLATFAEATVRAARHAADLIDTLTEHQREWRRQAGDPRSGSIARRLIEALPAQPVLTADVVAEIHRVDPNVARRGLKALEEAGVLRVVPGRERDRVWVADDIFDVLDEFELAIVRDSGQGVPVGPTRHLRPRPPQD